MESGKPPAAGPGPGGAKLEIKIGEETAQGQYTNLAIVNFTETEFVIDFLFIQPRQSGKDRGEAKVLSRILSGPVHTKRFLGALAESVRIYEQRFGVIDISPKGTLPPPAGTPSSGVLH